MTLLDRLNRHARKRSLALLPVVALGMPIAFTALLRMFPVVDVLFESADFHLLVVTIIAACAVGVALVAARAAQRSEDGATVLLALGCLLLGLAMLGHGLVTPGVIGQPVNRWVARLPVVAVVSFAGCLALATFGRHAVLTAVARNASWVLVAPASVLGALVIAVVPHPEALGGGTALPGEGTVSSVLVVASGIVLLAAGWRHWSRWRLGSGPVALALTLAAWLSAAALVSLEAGTLWHLSWWDYHGFLLAGFAAAVDAVLTSSRRENDVDEGLRTAFVTDPLEHIAHGYSEALRALVAAVEARDSYTHGHSARVAELSVRVGVNLRLPPDRLRQLAEGAYLHDVGKIGIPDRILNKPAALDDEEVAWVREHPVLGVDIASRAPSLRPALPVIRHHHERYDGLGYPDGLAEDDIPLTARIVAVADVWDALTSDRAYRTAWTRSDALRHLELGRGTHFDPNCLDAFLRVADALGIMPVPSDGDRAILLGNVAPPCHDHAGNRSH